MKSIYKFDNQKQKIIYLMTKSFRIRNNYTLKAAYDYAVRKNKSLEVIIAYHNEDNPRNVNYFNDMTEDLPNKLMKYASHASKKDPEKMDVERQLIDAHTVYIDKYYLKEDIAFFHKVNKVCQSKQISLNVIEANVFVPIEIASEKEEYAARTIRPKIHRQMHNFTRQVFLNEPLTKAEKAAKQALEDFIDNGLGKYDQRNDPSKDYSSGLSVYLKYGFISPVTIVDRLRPINSDNKEAFIEELVVRRELAYNYVFYNPDYTKFENITYEWAYDTMKKHISDKRQYIYSKQDYIDFKTHDKYFNAAMKEMVHFGTMKSYMRMYWCKKIIEWSKTYKEAFNIALELNNYYFLDGNTPNGYNGVAWCFGKHDRAWKERPIFGKLRYMNDNGLKAKFDADKYVEIIEKKINEKEGLK